MRLCILGNGVSRDSVRSSDTIVRLENFSGSFRTTIWDEISIRIADIALLGKLFSVIRRCGSTSRLRIRVDSRVSATHLHPPAGLVDGRSLLRASRTESTSFTEIYVRLGWHAKAWVVLSSLCTQPYAPASGLPNGFRLAYTNSIDSTWLPLDVQQFSVEESLGEGVDEENPGPTPAFDLALLPESSQADGSAPMGKSMSVKDQSHAVKHLATTEPSWAEIANGRRYFNLRNQIAPVEGRLFNPIGFRRGALAGWAYLEPHGEDMSALLDSQGRLISVLHDGISTSAIAAIREYTGIVDSGAAHSGPQAQAMFAQRALAAGVPVVSPALRADIASPMHSSVREMLLNDVSEIGTSEDREDWVMRQVRCAFRHSTWSSVEAQSRLGIVSSEESVSVLLATKRPEYLAHAIDNFDNQTWPNCELLIGLHGFGLGDIDSDLRARVERLGVVLEFPSACIFGDVLRALTNAASGDYIAKFDDDDWYAPHHLEDLVHAIKYSSAALVGSGVQFVYMHNADLTLRRSAEQAYRFGGHPGGPTFLMRRSTAMEAGNWPRVRRAVDTGMNDAILSLGGNVFQSHAHNFLFNRRSGGHTWQATNEYFIKGASEKWEGLRPPRGFESPTRSMVEWRSRPSRIGRIAATRRAESLPTSEEPPGLFR